MICSILFGIINKTNYIELPNGYLYFSPLSIGDRYRKENGRYQMPVTVRLNHAVADGHLVANVLQKELDALKNGGAL